METKRKSGAGRRFLESAPVWEFVRDEIYPRAAPIRREVRVWCVGEGSPESALALAMLWLAADGRRSRIRLLATHDDALLFERVRERRYTTADLDEVPKEFRDVYFEASGDDFQVLPELAPMVQCSRLDLASEPWPREIDLLVLDHALVEDWTPTQRVNALELAGRSMLSHAWLIVSGGSLPASDIDSDESLFESVEGVERIYRLRE